MPKAYRGLSQDRHNEVGQDLYTTRNRLLLLTVEISNAYGTSHKATRLAEKAYNAIDALRCELDDVLARETTSEEWREHDLQEVYYPATEARQPAA